LLETVAVLEGPGNVPLAPAAGAVKVTDTPFIGLPDSVTVACNAVAKAVPTVVLCVVPAVAAIT
jgi:hypothetical protein